MSVLYVSVGSDVGPRTFGFLPCVAVLVQIALIFCRVWSEQSARCFVWI